VDKKKIGVGALLVVGGGWIGREFVSWLFGRLLDALAAGAGERVTWATFPWQNLIGVILMALGLYMIFKSDTRTERNALLYERMSNLYDRLDSCVAAKSPGAYPDILGEATAIFESIENLGIPTPDLMGCDLHDTYRGAHLFVGALMPMIRDNHLRAARRESHKIITAIGVPECHPKQLPYALARKARTMIGQPH
jgi:hypothetical protein